MTNDEYTKRLKKKKNDLIVFLLTCVLLLTLPKGNDNNNKNPEHAKEIANKITKEIEDALLAEEIELSADCNITNEERKEIIKLINNITNNYNWEEFYITYDEVCNIIEMSKYNTKCNYEITYDSSKIVKKIEENSLDYLKFSFKYENIFEQELLKKSNICFEDVLKKVINDIIEKSTNDIKEDICVFQNLKIVSGNINRNNKDNITTLAEYNSLTNVIIVDLDAIKNMDSITGEINSTYLYRTLYHELSHARQNICKCREDKGQRIYNISYLYPYSSFMIESSAESVIYNQELNEDLNIKGEIYSSYTYNLERTAEELFFTLALTNDFSKTVDDYYNAIFDSNVEALWKFCGAESKEEIYRLYKIIYAIDGRFDRNSLLFDTRKEMDNKDSVEHIGYAYRVDLFKWNITNLINQTCSNSNITLEENLIIFNIIKNNIVDMLFTATFESDETIKYDDKFVQDIYELENTYIDFLCKYYQVSKEEIRSLEENEIAFNINDLANISKGNYDKDALISFSKEQKILEKYPLIKNLLINKYCYNDYELFLERTSTNLKNNSHSKIKKMN